MKTVNIDYLCVISEDHGKTVFNTVEIPASVVLVGKLEELVEKNEATLLDLQALMSDAFQSPERAAVSYVSPNSYCCAYIDYAIFPRAISPDEQIKIVSQKAEELRKDFAQSYGQVKPTDSSRYNTALAAYVNNGCAQYMKWLKNNYLREAKRFICARNYYNTLMKVREREEVRMYSTDTIGWTEFTYKVTDDISIHVSTNFGYGSASYFYLSLRYKGIDILPYSHIVKYYYADMRDILRFTRNYAPAHKSWHTAFSFVEETANLAAGSPKEFVRKWIMEEIRKMVSGLKKILEQPDEYIQEMLNETGNQADSHYLTVRHMYWGEKRRFEAYPSEMSLVLRSEKISGALDFLDNLTSLAETLPEIYAFISEIKETAMAILPQIDATIDKLTRETGALQEEKESKKEQLSSIKAMLEPHDKAIDEMYEGRCDDQLSQSRSYFEDRYEQEHAEYSDIKKEEAELCTEIAALAREMYMRSSFRSSLVDCAARITAEKMESEAA